MGNFLPRVIVDDFDKPSTASSNGDGCSVFEKRRGIEEAGFGRAGSAFSFHGSAFWVWMQQDLRQVRMPWEGTLGRHAQKARMDWRKKSQTSAFAAGDAAHDCSNTVLIQVTK
jgi:hypothetical protein